MPDGRIVYVSRVSGSQDVWIMNANGTEKRQLTTVATRADVDPSVPQDGRYIVFTSNRSGNSNIWRIDPDGGNPKQLTKGSGEEFPNVSPDGKTVVYTSTVSSKFTLWKVSIEGGEPVQLTDKLSQWPVVSPDGKTVACWFREEAKSPWEIAILPIEGGVPLKILQVASTAGTSIPVRWSADGKAITYIDTRDGVSNIWSQPLEGDSARKVTDFKSDQMFWFDWSRDGKNFTCARGSVTSDAILISGFRE
jgi:Tol biopolymer transport system component